MFICVPKILAKVQVAHLELHSFQNKVSLKLNVFHLVCTFLFCVCLQNGLCSAEEFVECPGNLILVVNVRGASKEVKEVE